MNKTIQFIEKEIEFYQLKIEKAKEEKLYRKTIALLLPENINLATDNEIEIALNEYKIKCLQQIKNDLEAWEVVKDKQVDVFYINVCKNADSYNKYKTSSKKLNNDEFEKIKKALGVENV